MFQMKGQDKTLKKINETEVSNLPNRKFKVLVIKMLTKLGIRMNTVRTSIKREYNKVPNTVTRTEESNNSTEK